MPYKVHKLVDDRRNTTCGFIIPNGGWYHVIEMTFENHKQLSDIGKMPGYSVDFVDGPTGMFDPDGNRVEPSSVTVDTILKLVTDYKKLDEKQSVHKDKERDELIARCTRSGIRIDQRWSTQRIKEVLDRSNQPVQSSLAVS